MWNIFIRNSRGNPIKLKAIDIIPEPKGATLKTIFNYIFSKHNGLQVLRKIYKVL